MQFSKCSRPFCLWILRVYRYFLCGVVSGLLTSGTWALAAQAPALRIDKGDCIVFIGNTFAERMHLFGYFETFLHSKFPGHQMKIRNMRWSADELSLQPRPTGFGDRHRYLEQEQVELIVACFGMNESFQGLDGLEKFAQDLDVLIQDLQSHQYNDRSAPRIVLVLPIAHENLGGLLPDGEGHNEHLQRYAQAIVDLAQRQNLKSTKTSHLNSVSLWSSYCLDTSRRALKFWTVRFCQNCSNSNTKRLRTLSLFWAVVM